MRSQQILPIWLDDATEIGCKFLLLAFQVGNEPISECRTNIQYEMPEKPLILDRTNRLKSLPIDGVE